MKLALLRLPLALTLLLDPNATTGPACAQSDDPRPVAGIMDNSFLIEEAYNQEPGVIQHIATAWYSVDRAQTGDTRSWEVSFTQEWPLQGPTHQLSYTIPYRILEAPGASANGVGDVLLHYRWQAWLEERSLTALAPRASVILPTGDARRGLGEDTVGLQANLPFSTAFSDVTFAHVNAGLTWLPEAQSAGGRGLLHYHAGVSTIYAAARDWHFLVEAVGYWNETPDATGRLAREFTGYLSPGLRKAFNFAGGPQLVLGAAVPLGMNRASADYGVFLYVSFEHSLRRP